MPLSNYRINSPCSFAAGMNETKKGFMQLHLSVMLAGFTGLFGRLITLNEVDIVWYRMLFGLERVDWRHLLLADRVLYGFV